MNSIEEEPTYSSLLSPLPTKVNLGDYFDDEKFEFVESERVSSDGPDRRFDSSSFGKDEVKWESPAESSWDQGVSLSSSMRVSSQPLQEIVEIERFRKTLMFLNLDSTQTRGCLLSWFAGVLLIGVVPLFEYIVVRPTDDSVEHELPFRTLSYILQTSLSGVSFLFLHFTVHKHSIRSVLFLDAASEENFSVQLEYEKILKSATTLLIKVFLPAFALHLVQKVWLFLKVPLVLLPFQLNNNFEVAEEFFVFIITSLSWVFEASTFLFTCVIFWKVCCLQELKMINYRDMLRKCVDPAYCFREYSRIIQGLSIISHRFRLFLALTMSITLFGGLASMYQMVVHSNENLSFFNSGDLVVANWLGLMGAGLCLKSASKVAHLHRRIIKVAFTMHAQHTYSQVITPCNFSQPNDDLESRIRRQEEWMSRSSLVNYLANTTAGISIYGFVLDRTFVHTSFGALLTTTWFILGQSISGS